MISFSHLIFAVLIIFILSIGRPVVRRFAEYVYGHLVQRARARVVEREGEYIQGRYQPFGIPVRGYIDHPHRHIPIPGAPPFPSNEVWITTNPLHNDDDHQFFPRRHMTTISYLYYPQRFNRFYHQLFWNQINYPPNEDPFPPVHIHVQVHAEVRSQGPASES